MATPRSSTSTYETTRQPSINSLPAPSIVSLATSGQPSPTPLPSGPEPPVLVQPQQVLTEALAYFERRLPQLNALALEALRNVEDIRRKAIEQDIERAKWSPWLATVLAINIAIWLSIIFWVTDINFYYTNGNSYETIGWIGIFFPISIILLIFIWSPKPKWFQKWRAGLTKSLSSAIASYGGSIANASVCILVVIVYLRAVALPRYGRPVWDSRVVYNDTLTPPAFAFLGGGTYNDAAMAKFTGGGTVCTFPQYADGSSADCPAAFSDEQSTLRIDSGVYGDFQAYIFDPLELQAGKNSYSALSDRVLLRVNMNYNKTNLEIAYGMAAVQMPFIHAVLFDPRIDLAKGLRCGLVSLTEIPALASNTFTITAETILDTLEVIQPADAQPECISLYTTTLAMTNPPYTSYFFNLASLPLSNPDLCDSSANVEALCTSQALLRYGTRVVRAMESKRDMGKIDILVNEGAIVGAIQFFAWILGLFSLGK